MTTHTTETIIEKVAMKIATEKIPTIWEELCSSGDMDVIRRGASQHLARVRFAQKEELNILKMLRKTSSR